MQGFKYLINNLETETHPFCMAFFSFLFQRMRAKKENAQTWLSFMTIFNHFHLPSLIPLIKGPQRHLSYKISVQWKSETITHFYLSHPTTFRIQNINQFFKQWVQACKTSNNWETRNKIQTKWDQQPYQAFSRSSKILVDWETPMSRGRPSCTKLSSPLMGKATRVLLVALWYSTSKYIPYSTMARPTKVNKKFRSFNRRSKHTLHAILYDSSNPFKSKSKWVSPISFNSQYYLHKSITFTPKINNLDI